MTQLSIRPLLGTTACGRVLKEIIDLRDIPRAIVCDFDTGKGSMMYCFEIWVQLQGKVKKKAEI
ncbi:MAG: hypothetical protein NMNS01_25880 [Nitrosomonas sp.]|nr:MAG: hypothetical protein NMNS01_25880 [Nitrosomonas sp.]